MNARIAAINSAIEEAEALRFRPDQSGVGQRLTTLRASIAGGEVGPDPATITAIPRNDQQHLFKAKEVAPHA